MFSKLISTTKWCPDVISIDDLICLIKEPKQVDFSDFYNYKVHSAAAYKAHGIFKGLGKADLIQFSNFLFYDIDDADDINKIKQDLADAGATLVYNSLSGKGIHFLVELNFEVKDVNDFEEVYASYFNYYKEKGFKLDSNAKGVNRSVVIGFDNEPLYTGNTSGRIMLDNGIRRHLEVPFTPVWIYGKGTRLNGTLQNRQYKTHIVIPDEIEYIIQEISNYIKIYFPNDIKDGEKHKRYKKGIIEFMTLNPEASLNEIQKWLVSVNNKQNPKMINSKLFKLIKNTYDWVKKENIKAKGRKKIIHFNSNSQLSVKEKQSIAAKEMGKIKKNKTINEIKQFMVDNDFKPTQKEAALSLGLGLRTIKRYWKDIK